MADRAEELANEIDAYLETGEPQLGDFMDDEFRVISTSLREAPALCAENASLRAMLREAGEALAWTKPAMNALAGLERDWGDKPDDDMEVGRVDESRDSASFRIRVGHIRAASSIASRIEEIPHD